MLTLVFKRAREQWRLLTTVVVLIAAAASLVGVCSLLLGVTQDRAFHEEVERSEPDDVAATAYLVDVAGTDLKQAQADAESVVSDIFAPMQPTVTSTATAPMRRLNDTDRLGYLMTGDALAQRADLTSGRWPVDAPTGPIETVVPDATARLLGLGLGDRVSLGKEIEITGVDNVIDLVVVGTFRPHSGADWSTDPLAGSGFDAAYSNGAVTAPAYGPFAIADASFLATGSSASGLRVTAHPTLSLADESSLNDAVDELGQATALLSSRVEDRARIARVGSALPQTLGQIQAQQSSTHATVLVVLLLSAALATAAAFLAGQLVASVREGERTLLVGWGLSRRQQFGAAIGEALLLAGTAGVLAVPIAAIAHSRLTHLPALEAAGLAQSPTLTWALVLSVLASAVLLALVLVVTAQTGRAVLDPTARRWEVVRFGLDALLVAIAVFAWWQLRSQPATATTSGDVTLTAAPVLCVAAATVVAARVVPLLLAAAAGIGLRSRALVLPLALQQAARRPQAGAAMVLTAAAVTAAVFGLALRTTWEQSQDDQATLRVGTDLALTLVSPAGAQEAAEVAGALAHDSDGSSTAPVVSQVVNRPLALGRYVGDAGSRPVLVAVDTRNSGGLLRGRLDSGTSWAEVGSQLAPEESVDGLALPDEAAGVTIKGKAPDEAALTVRPTVVVQDADGFRHSVAADSVAMDGSSHPVEWLEPIGSGQQLVGVRLDVDGSPGKDTAADLSITVSIPGQAADGGSDWQVQPLQMDNAIRGGTVAVAQTEAGMKLRTKASIDLTYLAYINGSMLATAFTMPSDVPVAVSQDLAAATGSKIDDELSAVVGGTTLGFRVAAIVPTVPSAPGQVAVLADADTLSRTLISSGSLDPVVDGWWVGHPTPEMAGELRGLALGEVTSRQQAATQLAQGPLRVTVPTALLTLVLAAVVMLLAGVVLVLRGDQARRPGDVARLRALGLTPQDARRLLLAEHGAFLVPLVLVGTLVGAASALLIGPQLIRSDLGAAPVPSAVVAWPWAAEAILVGGLLVGALVITAVMTAVQVRRAEPARLRAGDA